MNLYAYAGNNPIMFDDPFGDTTEVGFRPLANGAGAFNAHAAIRVGGNGQWHEIQLLPDSNDDKNNVTVSTGNEGPLQGNFEWTVVQVPAGQTQSQFDQNTLKAGAEVSKAFQGKDYDAGGMTNSNQFIHQIIKKAGGSLSPQWNLPTHLNAPGICGGNPKKPLEEGPTKNC